MPSRPLILLLLHNMVGMTGFEPATSRSQSVRSAKLSYIPLNNSASHRCVPPCYQDRNESLVAPTLLLVLPVGFEPTSAFPHQIKSLFPSARLGHESNVYDEILIRKSSGSLVAFFLLHETQDGTTFSLECVPLLDSGIK